MTASQPDFSDLNALAIEACDMWQEHLSTLANDPAARAELTRFLEPQRRLFADWAAMMQKGAFHTGNKDATQQGGGQHDDSSQRSPHTGDAGGAGTAPANETAPPSRGDDAGDDPLRVAQLAYRLAELEKRVAALESGNGAGAAGPPRRTQRATS
ncbi:MAG: hypothetical protein KGI97_05815 [Alphaproteobacteria bacterium]|nr:hypothetical protein [Alphaproteobacteria bacterium]